MTTTQQDAGIASDEEVAIAFTLAVATGHHPELRRAEARMRLRLAASIQAMDAVRSVPGRHDLNEQAAVELASQAYVKALATLIRGDDSA